MMRRRDGQREMLFSKCVLRAPLLCKNIYLGGKRDMTNDPTLFVLNRLFVVRGIYLFIFIAIIYLFFA